MKRFKFSGFYLQHRSNSSPEYFFLERYKSSHSGKERPFSGLSSSCYEVYQTTVMFQQEIKYLFMEEEAQESRSQTVK